MSSCATVVRPVGLMMIPQRQRPHAKDPNCLTPPPTHCFTHPHPPTETRPYRLIYLVHPHPPTLSHILTHSQTHIYCFTATTLIHPYRCLTHSHPHSLSQTSSPTARLTPTLYHPPTLYYTLILSHTCLSHIMLSHPPTLYRTLIPSHTHNTVSPASILSHI